MITLHHCEESRSMRSLWLLYELGVDFEVKVHSFGPELREADYLAVHPLGRVPCLIEGDVKLYESGAITQYLCEQYSPDLLGRQIGNPERIEWLQWLHYAETVAVHGATLTQQHIVIYDDHDRSPLLMKLEKRRLEKTLEVLDHHLAGRDFLLASGFSAVDTNIGYSVHIARYFTDLDQFPNLQSYYGQLSKREGFQRSLPEKPAIYLKSFYEVPNG